MDLVPKSLKVKSPMIAETKEALPLNQPTVDAKNVHSHPPMKS